MWIQFFLLAHENPLIPQGQLERSSSSPLLLQLQPQRTGVALPSLPAVPTPGVTMEIGRLWVARALRAPLTGSVNLVRFVQVPSSRLASAQIRTEFILDGMVWVRGLGVQSLWDQTNVGSSPSSATCSCVTQGLLYPPEVPGFHLQAGLMIPTA